MTDDTRATIDDTRSTTDDARTTPDDPRPATDADRPESGTERSRPATGVQSPTATIDPTAESGHGLPLERRHVIASALAAVGLAGVGTAQARHESGNQGQGQSDIDVKTGIVSHESPGAAEDGTWNTFEVDQQTVEFEEAFEAPPVVFVGSTSYTSIGLFRAIDVTEEGFESRWMVYRSESFAAPDAQWVAVGQS